MSISFVDQAILVGYLAGMVGFGIFMGRGQRTTADYMVGSRNVPWWVILFSIVATETSTVTFLGIPGVAWASDLRFLQLPLGYIAGRLVVCFVLMPGYFRGDLFTAYEVLDRRFGGAVKRWASGIFVVTRTLGDGLRLALSAIILKATLNVSIETAVIGLGVATILYTFVGGMKAVLWTDCVQFFVYMAGAAIAFWVLLGKIDGGWDAVERLAETGDKLRVFDFGFNLTESYLFWTGLIGGAIFAVGTHGVDQMMVQRYLSARNERDAKLALALSGPVVFLQFAFFLLIGVALYAFYTQHPRTFAKADQVFATFIVDHLPVGVLGIVLGAVFSAAMSTLSSSLNSAATALTHDILRLPAGADADRQRLSWVKWLTVVVGVAQIVVGIAGEYLRENTPVVDTILHIQGLTTGIILGLFCLGMFASRVDRRSALAGLIGGLLVVCAVEFIVPLYLPRLAWPWFVLVGCAATYLIGLGAAFLPARDRRAA